MNRSICLFEDEKWFNLNPLVYFIPSYELRCGILTLKRKVEKHFNGDKVLIHSRRYLAETLIGQLYTNILFDSYYSEEWIFINGRVIADDQLVKTINSLKEDTILKHNDTVIAAFLGKESVKQLFAENNEFPDFNKLANIPVKNVNTRYIAYPWDLVKYNGEEIVNDYKMINADTENNMKNFEGVIFHNRNHIFLGTRCEIEPYVFLNAEKGPIYIGDNVKIYSHTSIEGPAFIGHNSVIKTHTSIYNNTSIGPVSKVGGEIENSIIHSYTNKQHYGFLGHSYLGQWINLGAGTTNSDLKNNYSNIRVKYNNDDIDTGMTFLGALIGDNTKTAIGTRLTTGSLIGACCNIISDGIAPNFLAPFTWLHKDEYLEYDLNKIIETTKLVYSRRGIIFTDSDSKLIREVYKYVQSQNKV
jgi:UDP-N-acetylglucosamine diphosphorylase / glucose-1-phosphate thymidylyltransferase / UDP-N-acetylgalactosamine diphosphorylase / glucosamine-1-phosphate N-acetyltransferase / galactosamine-1-phosphate N-acetyltransferase